MNIVTSRVAYLRTALADLQMGVVERVTLATALQTVLLTDVIRTVGSHRRRHRNRSNWHVACLACAVRTKRLFYSALAEYGGDRVCLSAITSSELQVRSSPNFYARYQ